MRLVKCFLLLFWGVCLQHRVLSAGFQYVTCGSVLKLANSDHNMRLHSHEVKYGSGSGQQSVTGAKFLDDVNSYWLVRGPHNGNCDRGTPVKCDSTIRLQHLGTRLFLHSHNFRSPLSQAQEVSCFGDGSSQGDSGDNWVVECQGEQWSRDENVRLRHADTSAYLQASGQTYGRPIQGQMEIAATRSKSSNTLWKAMEGVYMDPEKTQL